LDVSVRRGHFEEGHNPKEAVSQRGVSRRVIQIAAAEQGRSFGSQNKGSEIHSASIAVAK
jgi:hypothetical protein